MVHCAWIFLRNVAIVSAALVLTIAIAAADNASPPVTWVTGSTVPLLQLPGEKFQYYANSYYFRENTNATTLTTADVYGADLGVPVTFPDKIVILFGDTWSTYKTATGHYIKWRGWGRTTAVGTSIGPWTLASATPLNTLTPRSWPERARPFPTIAPAQN